MKLKGKNAEKLKDKDREKKEKTLKRMEENRTKDSVMLRSKIGAKMEVLKAEFEKANKCILELQTKISEIEHTKSRISGAYTALEELVK